MSEIHRNLRLKELTQNELPLLEQTFNPVKFSESKTESKENYSTKINLCKELENILNTKSGNTIEDDLFKKKKITIINVKPKLEDTLEVFMEELKKVQVSINDFKNLNSEIDTKIQKLQNASVKLEVNQLEITNEEFLKNFDAKLDKMNTISD